LGNVGPASQLSDCERATFSRVLLQEALFPRVAKNEMRLAHLPEVERIGNPTHHRSHWPVHGNSALRRLGGRLHDLPHLSKSRRFNRHLETGVSRELLLQRLPYEVNEGLAKRGADRRLWLPPIERLEMLR